MSFRYRCFRLIPLTEQKHVMLLFAIRTLNFYSL